MKNKKKLGELLVDAGLASRLEIDHALQAQKVFGGRLGINLIESGAIDGETLAGFLSQQYGVPRVTLSEMENLSDETLKLVPVKAAQRLCFLPLGMKDERLVLAMLDPSEDRVIQRIESNLNVKVEPRVATEVELRYFLEKYYGVPRDARHITLMNQMLAQRDKTSDVYTNIQLLAQQLDKHGNPSLAIEHFFGKIGSLDRVPIRNKVVDIRQYDLTPQLTFVLEQVDGISSLRDIFSSCAIPRVLTLRAMVFLSDQGLIRFEEA